jgi:hypothetical protein
VGQDRVPADDLPFELCFQGVLLAQNEAIDVDLRGFRA